MNSRDQIRHVTVRPVYIEARICMRGIQVVFSIKMVSRTALLARRGACQSTCAIALNLQKFIILVSLPEEIFICRQKKNVLRSIVISELLCIVCMFV